MAKQSGLKASNMGDVYVKLDDAERILGEKFSMPVQVTVMQALRALPVSDGVTDEMVERAVSAFLNIQPNEGSDDDVCNQAMRAALQAALGPLPVPPSD